MKIHKEGYLIILSSIIILSGINFILFSLINLPIITYSLLFISTIFFGLILNFFRVPVRKIEINNDHILAPSDGKLVVIENIYEAEYLNTECIQLSIFMSPLNVHKQWYPINGTIEYVKYHPGKYYVAWHPKSSTENERSTIVIASNKGEKVLFRQIAGAVARRICNYSSVNNKVSQSDEAGFIKFGSRIDVLIPKSASIKVNINDKIIGGQTILATI